MASRRASRKNVKQVLQRFAEWAHEYGDYRFYAQLNRWLDDLLSEDAFGTEGQLDPRGDHRE